MYTMSVGHYSDTLHGNLSVSRHWEVSIHDRRSDPNVMKPDLRKIHPIGWPLREYAR